jgi:hypothetical protein
MTGLATRRFLPLGDQVKWLNALTAREGRHADVDHGQRRRARLPENRGLPVCGV